MTRTCEWCGEPITFVESQTTSGNAAWHTRCWNQAAEQRAAYIAECEDCEGFTRRPLPDELPMSETGAIRSEVIPIMSTTAPNPRAPREVVEFPPNAPVTVALKYPHAKTVSSQSGERFMFSLADGRVMFLAPEVGGKIEALGINVRENFQITRKWDEQKSLSTWEVARLAGEQPNGTLVLPLAGETEGKVSPKPPASASASNGADHRKTAGALLIDETNALVDAYAQILERTLTTYQGRIKPEEARSLLVTAYIQRSKLSFAA
jgi:hypothetical protein